MKLKGSFSKLKNSGFLKVIRNKYLLILSIFTIWITFFDSSNILRCTRIKINIKEQEIRKEYYQNQIESIEQKLHQLDSNRDSLERFAREQYLFKENDEDIYILKEREN